MHHGRILGLQILDQMLGKKPRAQLAAAPDVARHGFQASFDQFGQGRFAVAIAAQQGDPVLAVDPQIEAREDWHPVFIARRGTVQADNG